MELSNSKITHNNLPLRIQEKLGKIRLFITDFDGVWTDNLVLHSQDGKESVMRSKADSQGIDLLSDAGLYDKKNYTRLDHPLDILILSREANPLVKNISDKVGVKCIYAQYAKADILYEETKKRGLTLDQVLYLGNDINDIECMKKVGLAAAVEDSYPAVLKIADYVTRTRGGHGAVRELIELLLESKKQSSSLVNNL